MSYDNLKRFAVYCRAMQEKNFDIFIPISSRKGFGKSTLAAQSVRVYLKMFGLQCNEESCKFFWVISKNVMTKELSRQRRQGERFYQTIERVRLHEPCLKCKSNNVSRFVDMTADHFDYFLAWDNDDIMDKIYDRPMYTPIWADEGVRLFMGEDWNKSDNKRLKKLFAQMRTQRYIIFANIPKLDWMEGKYRDDMATFWMRLIGRSRVALLQPDLGEVDDAWHLRDFQKKLGTYFYSASEEELDDKMDKLMKHKCVYDTFRFPALPKALQEAYDEARYRHVFEDSQDDEIDQKDLAKIILYNLTNHWKSFIDGVEKTRFKVPTLKVIEEHLTRDPITQERLLRFQTIGDWLKDFKAIIRRQKPELLTEKTTS